MRVLLFLVFLSVCFAAPAGGRESSPYTYIGTLSISGNEDISVSDIKDVISEIVPPRRILFWKGYPPFDRLAVERNIEGLREFLVGSGYHQSYVIWRESARESGAVDIAIDIDLGNPVLVSEVIINVEEDGFPPEHMSRLFKALDEVPLKRGERFSVRRFKKAKGVVKNTLLEMGYAAAEVESKGEVYRSERRAVITFALAPGRVHAFGDIEIRVSDEDLRDVVIGAVTYKTGEPSSPSKIRETKRWLVNLGYFESVSITPHVDSETASVSTVITAVKRKSRTFQISAGVGRVDKARVRAKFINRNFLNLNRTLELSARASFASQSASVTVQQPGAFGPDSIFSALFEINRDDYPSYEADFLVWSTELKKDLADRLVSVYFTPTVIDSDIRAKASDDDIARGLENIFLVLLRGGISLADTDNPVDPLRGFALGLDYEFSADFLGSEEEYLTSVFEAAGYYNVGPVVFAKRFQIGSIETFGRTRRTDVPLFVRLFAGGHKSMRGFSFQKLGPLDSDKDPLGGNSLLTGSAEVRFPVRTPKLGGVVFMDYGNVFPGSFDYQTDDLRYAVGFGLRYKVSGIPVAFDFGYTLNPDSRLRKYQVFLDIGQAF